MSTLLASCPSPFESLEKSFRLLSSGPSQPRLDVSGVEGIAVAQVTPAELVGLLRHVPSATSDALWRRLVRRARAQGSTWMVVAVALALPGLRSVARRWEQDGGLDRHDLEAEVLTQVLGALRRLDLGEPHICARLCYAASKAAQRYSYRHQRDHDHLVALSEARTPGGVSTPAHPERVLAQAVNAGVLTITDSELIARSRLEPRGLQSVASELGLPYGTAQWRRRMAERAVAAWIIGKNSVSS